MRQEPAGFNYGALITPKRAYNYTYLATSPYTSRHIRNRLLTASVTGGSQTISLRSNTYDNYGAQQGCPSRSLYSRTGMREQDTAGYGSGFTT